MEKEALGMVETKGLVGAIEADGESGQRAADRQGEDWQRAGDGDGARGCRRGKGVGGCGCGGGQTRGRAVQRARDTPAAQRSGIHTSGSAVNTGFFRYRQNSR